MNLIIHYAPLARILFHPSIKQTIHVFAVGAAAILMSCNNHQNLSQEKVYEIRVHTIITMPREVLYKMKLEIELRFSKQKKSNRNNEKCN